MTEHFDRTNYLLGQNQDVLKQVEALAIAPEPAPEAPEYSDDALALRFSARYAEDLRYTATWGKWHRWNGSQWEPDSTLRVFDLAREVCREAALECGEESKNTAKRMTSAVTVAAIERLARCDRRHATAVEQWDTDPWLLNTPTGTVDLRTGQLREHKRCDYCTKRTAVTPRGDCPRWREFLNRVMNRDAELQAFIQRVVGYSLTGATSEHGFFFAYGTGANGKSVFTSTVQNILADYAKAAPMEAFLASSTDSHPTDVAGLQGARLVIATEVEDGRRWAESRLKSLTGGDRISARFMRQDFFEFLPQFKLFITGNHKPTIRTVDEAIRRRLYLIPFNVTIPPNERDLQLAEKLKSEWGGILEWAIQGCLVWQRDGLQAPARVREATNEYLAAQDSLTEWLEECVEAVPDFVTTTKELYGAWRIWTEARGEYPGTEQRFAERLTERGRQKGRQGGTGRKGFRGIALREL